MNNQLKSKLGWLVIALWLGLSVLMAILAATPSEFAYPMPEQPTYYPWAGVLVLSVALVLLLGNEYAWFTGRLVQAGMWVATVVYAIIPLFLLVLAVLVSMHAAAYVAVFIQTVVCVNVVHFSVGWLCRYRAGKTLD